MDNYRLKVTVAGHEFDGEGTPADVKEQFRDFKELVTLALSSAPFAQPSPPPLDGRTMAGNGAADQAPLPLRVEAAGQATDGSLAKIMKVDGRIVSLTMRAPSIEGAILLIVYGQKVLRQNDSVSGGELLDGLKTTGGLSFGRIDRLMEKAAADGDIAVSGERRAKRYRLTNTGLNKARQIATDLIAIVA